MVAPPAATRMRPMEVAKESELLSRVEILGSLPNKAMDGDCVARRRDLNRVLEDIAEDLRHRKAIDIKNRLTSDFFF
jgi:hypothetical protein